MSKNLEILESYNNVIWDWNGTLVNDLSYAVKVVQSLLESHGLDTICEKVYKESFSIPVIDFYNRLGFKTKGQSFEEISKHFMQKYYEGFDQLQIYEEALASIKALHKNGTSQSVLSAAQENDLISWAKKFQLDSYFDFISGQSDHSAGCKVDQAHMLKAQLPQNTKGLYVGDTSNDAQVAEALGFDFAFITNGHQNLSRLDGFKVHHTITWGS